MDMKKLLSIVDNSETKSKTVITEGTNMAHQMVMQQYSKTQQTAPKFKSNINEYLKVVNNEMLGALQEQQEQKKIEVKRIVDRVLTRMDEGKTVKVEAPKPRNFVAKNATTSGAGAHKDKKKADKQGDVKHKAKALDLAELRTEVKDKDGKVTSWKDEGEWKKADTKKNPRGRVTNLSDKARRETEKQDKDRADETAYFDPTLAKDNDDSAIQKFAQQGQDKLNLEKQQRSFQDRMAKIGKKYTPGMKSWDVEDAERAYAKEKAARAPKLEDRELTEKAVSKSQQKLMGMVHAAQKGEKPASKEVAKIAKGMGKKDAEDFASTKHKGLPEKKKTVKESYGSVEVGAPVKVYSNVLKKAVFGKVVRLKEGRAYVQYDNTKIVMGHPIDAVQLNEAAAAATGAKVAAATGGKLASRLIPGVGAAVGAYDAYDRAKKGDYIGASLSGLGALTSFIPGVGTAATMGLAGAQLARDYKKKTGAFAPDEADAATQTATPATAPGAMTPNPKAPAAAAPSIKDPVALQKALIAAGANLGPTGADGDIGKLTKAAMADPKYAEIVKKYTAAPTQTATPASNSNLAAAARAVAPAAASVARQALTK